MAPRMVKYWVKARQVIVRRLRYTKFYPALYPSAWRARWLGEPMFTKDTAKAYFTAVPHPGAGIGHQIANWIAGYWFARQFGLRYSHSPFPAAKWEALLGFGQGEVPVNALYTQGYRAIRLPKFDEDNEAEVDRIRRIIRSYRGKQVVFVAEQDQFYRDQHGVMHSIRAKFEQAFATNPPKLRFETGVLNIAVHVRRGDIGSTGRSEQPNLAMRWQHEDYFLNVTKRAIEALPQGQIYRIWLFSQGRSKDFSAFTALPNVTLCLDVGASEAFQHMAKADVLITSKSSFSYKPALLNVGIKICPDDFWHSYPDTPDWIIADSNGDFSSTDFTKARLDLTALRETPGGIAI